MNVKQKADLMLEEFTYRFNEAVRAAGWKGERAARQAGIAKVTFNRMRCGENVEMSGLGLALELLGFPNVAGAPQRLGRKIKSLRGAAILTQKQLAELCGIKKDVLGQIERGHNAPRLHTMARICAALDVDLWKMLTEVPHEHR